jgi:hypothetical protein
MVKMKCVSMNIISRQNFEWKFPNLTKHIRKHNKRKWKNNNTNKPSKITCSNENMEKS